MSKLQARDFDNEVICGCGYGTTRLYGIGKKPPATDGKKGRAEEGLCSICIAELIYDEGYNIGGAK